MQHNKRFEKVISKCNNLRMMMRGEQLGTQNNKAGEFRYQFLGRSKELGDDKPTQRNTTYYVHGNKILHNFCKYTRSSSIYGAAESLQVVTYLQHSYTYVCTACLQLVYNQVLFTQQSCLQVVEQLSRFPAHFTKSISTVMSMLKRLYRP